MLLKRWEPFSEIREIRRYESDIDRIWRHMFGPIHTGPYNHDGYGRVAIDVYQDSERLTVSASVPGVKPEDLEVTVADDILTITGERKVEREVKKEEEYLHREHRFGVFRRTVSLPEGLDAGKAESSYENGILTVTIPKSEERKPKALKIVVKPAGGKKD